MAEARLRRATRAGVAWRRGTASASTRGQSLASVDMAAGARRLRVSGRGHLRPDECGEGRGVAVVQGWASGVPPPHVFIDGQGWTARWRADSGGHEQNDQMARLLRALASEGSEGESVEQEMDAGIHPID